MVWRVGLVGVASSLFVLCEELLNETYNAARVEMAVAIGRLLQLRGGVAGRKVDALLPEIAPSANYALAGFQASCAHNYGTGDATIGSSEACSDRRWFLTLHDIINTTMQPESLLNAAHIALLPPARTLEKTPGAPYPHGTAASSTGSSRALDFTGVYHL